jgi:hypothetical protein
MFVTTLRTVGSRKEAGSVSYLPDDGKRRGSYRRSSKISWAAVAAIVA